MPEPKLALHATTPRLFIEGDLHKDIVIVPKPDQIHYLTHVMRMQAGSSLRLFNGADGEWLAEITEISKKSLKIIPLTQIRPQPAELTLHLKCAPIKKAHFDYLIEKATELGVSSIQPLLTSRTQIREVNLERCRAIAIEAAEQSGRLNIPNILPTIMLKELGSKDLENDLKIVCAERGDATPIGKAFQPIRKDTKLFVSVITGPEGGFAEDELRLLKVIPNCIFVRLGSRILRADTAAIATLSCWQAICGDWQTNM